MDSKAFPPPKTSLLSPATPHPIRRNPIVSHTVPIRLPCKVLKRVLRVSRMPAANRLTSILDDIVKRNDDASEDWLFKILSFACGALGSPREEDKEGV